MKKHILHILLISLMLSCRKDVTLDMPGYRQKVVIEGSIETGGTALVFLSYSIPYFGNFDYNTPANAFIRGALVTVSDGHTTDTLREIDPSVGYVYAGFRLRGEQGRVYTLRVEVDQQVFETSSQILSPHRLDSLYFIEVRGDSLGFIGQRLREPPGGGDCYRWMARRLGRDLFYAAPFNSVFDDKFIDGQPFVFSYNRGIQPDPFLQGGDDPERGYYKRGDTVLVKFCRIGRREYEFWSTYYQNKTSNGNPFSSPANVKSMFGSSENCLGAFVAYAPAIDTLIIPGR
jgi:hypothetical protein